MPDSKPQPRDSRSRTTSNRWSRREWSLGLAVVLTGLVALPIGMVWQRSALPTQQDAQRAFLRGDYREAEQSAVEVGQRTGSTECFLIAARAASRLNRTDTALDYYGLVEGEEPEHGIEQLVEAGDALMRGRRPSVAETKFRLALARSPSAAEPRDRLALLLLITGRRQEALPFLFDSVKRGQNTVHTLCLLAQADGTNALPAQFDATGEAANDESGRVDPLLRLATARQEIENGNWMAARSQLEQIREDVSVRLEAHLLLGRVFLELNDEVAFERWIADSSDNAQHPAFWSLHGEWATRQGNSAVAARAFWEAVRRDPNDAAANFRLGQALQALDRNAEAQPFLDRASLLERLSTAAETLYTNPNDLDRLQEASDISLQLGRLWESWGWARYAERLNSANGRSQARIQSLEPQLASDPPQTLASHRPATRINLSDLPLPEQAPSIASGGDLPTVPVSTTIDFTDVAAEVGLVMSYTNGSPRGRPGHRMHQITGGGLGVIDVDVDGHPDLFATQGRSFPATDDGNQTDRLFRNLGETFIDITAIAGCSEAPIGFGQGVASGDWNADGFNDLYIANIGQNRLLRNNGDGTFHDVTAHAGIPAPPLVTSWTTSAVMADVTGDGLADLFDVNYVTDDDVFERVCSGSNGIARSCPPTEFEACPDRLLVNLGEGRFEDQTTQAGIVAPKGNGLGVVAADLNGSGQPGLFVANDQTANHFFVRTSTAPLRFEERALSCGLAFDGSGKTQACMGVAADDADGDGSIDLFVTNFYLEANTLYCQREPGLFQDDTARAGLREPSYRLLGFGTQFLDADRDGWPDLLLTNGHIDDFTALDIPFRMRPQFFRNHRGRFQEVPPDSLDAFFRKERLGRSLATLDWNGDGQQDAALSHLDAPLALLTNRSRAGHGLGITLAAVQSERTAIGATVTIESSNGVRTRQLTAGDGYMASNERRLSFGLGAARSGEARVRWPSGDTESFGELDAGSEWLLVEGRGRPLRLGDHRSVTTPSP